MKTGTGIFSEADRQRDTRGPELPAEPVKVSDGLWLVPKEEDGGEAKDNGTGTVLGTGKY